MKYSAGKCEFGILSVKQTQMCRNPLIMLQDLIYIAEEKPLESME
jgi:hypothetical protein